MNAEYLDLAILRVLDENDTRFGLGAPALSLLVGRYGVTLGSEDLRRRLEYMADAALGYVAPVQKGEFHPENLAWKITTKGVNHLRQLGH